MRRILASLFVIASVVGLGVMATGAYFTDTITLDNYTFETGTADLKFGNCAGEGADCSSTPATLDSWTFSTSQQIGPGIVNSGCMVIENTGDYALDLSSTFSVLSYSHPDMLTAFEAQSQQANSSCQATNTLQDWASAGSLHNTTFDPALVLDPGERLYVILRNRWNSAGDQDHLQNGQIRIRTVIEGKTV
jgi:hypothetical protein